jgi:hypothetical protein
MLINQVVLLLDTYRERLRGMHAALLPQQLLCKRAAPVPLPACFDACGRRKLIF